MGNDNSEVSTRRIVWGLVKTGLLTFVFFLLLSGLLVVIFYADVPAEERSNMPIMISLIFINAVAFYFAYAKKSVADYDTKGKTSFIIKDELKQYIHSSEGKNFFMIYGILVVSYEIVTHALPMSNPITLALSMLFPIAPLFYSIPILDMVVAYAVTMIMVLAVTVYARYREYKYWCLDKDK